MLVYSLLGRIVVSTGTCVSHVAKLRLPSGNDEQCAKRTYMGYPMENHRKTMGKWRFNGCLMGCNL